MDRGRSSADRDDHCGPALRPQRHDGPVRTGDGAVHVAVRIRDEIVAPNVGSKWVNTYTPLILVFFLFIVTANAIGMLPVFDLLAL